MINQKEIIESFLKRIEGHSCHYHKQKEKEILLHIKILLREDCICKNCIARRENCK